VSQKNNYGLSRVIPSNVKREVRQRCKFGCVICGFPIYDYEHFNPEFKDLKDEHKSEGITLLCPNCHRQKTNSEIPIEDIINYNKNPYCANNKYIKGKFNFKKDESLIIKFAGSTYSNLDSVINIGSTSVLSICKSENKYEPFLLSGSFYDTSGKMTLIINRNNWVSNINQWDIEKVGSGIKIRESKSKVVLDIKINHNKEVVINRIQMQYKKVFLDGNKDSLKIFSEGKMLMEISNCQMSSARVGIQIGNEHENKDFVNKTTNFNIDN